MKKNAKPIQARSQKTRENILRAALEMYAKKGYYSTTVDEIAAEAGVSTGIAYRYFKNKKDILLSSISYGAENIGSIADTDKLTVPNGIADMVDFLEAVLKNFEELHFRFRDIHEELEGLRHTDKDVRDLYYTISTKMMEDAIEKLDNILEKNEHIREKAYLAVNIMEQYCHMKMDCEAVALDFDVLREKTIKAVICIFS